MSRGPHSSTRCRSAHAILAAATAAAALVGCGNSQAHALSTASFPLSVQLRALKLAPDGSGTYVVVVRNWSDRRTAPITLVLAQQSQGLVVGMGTTHPHLTLATGIVRADVPLRAVTTAGRRGYLARLPGLAAGASRTIGVSATAAKPGTLMRCLIAGVLPGASTPRDPATLPAPSMLASSCTRPAGGVLPLPFGVELQGLSSTHVGAKATYTIIVRNHTATTVRNGVISIEQVSPLTHRSVPVTTDWPVTRTTAAGGQEALLTHLAPHASVTFHVTMRVPPPGKTLTGEPLSFGTFSIGASRRTHGGEQLLAELSSTLSR